MINKHSFYLIKEESPYNDMIDIMFRDVNINEFTEKRHSSLFKFFLKNKIQDNIGWIINPIISRLFGLYKYIKKIDNQDQKYFIFLNSSFIESRFPKFAMQYYKGLRPNIKFILLYIDIISDPVSSHANKLREYGLFDAVYTVDKNDASKYGINFIRTPYSFDPNIKNLGKKSTLYFCGATKDRGRLIQEIIDRAEANSVEYEFEIRCHECEKKYFEKQDGVNLLNNFISYKILLNNTIQSSCILDLVQKGQSALTLRPYEAVVYNKKLLTNNKAIMDFEFYNAKYMQYFEKVDDIDWDWVKREEKINYEYNGDFSPKCFVRRIINDTK